MKGANDGIWDWDLSTDKVYYSPRWKSMLGYEDSELEHHINTWGKLVFPEDKNKVLNEVQNCINGKKEDFEIEMRMKHKDGHEVIVLSRAFLLRDEIDKRAIRLVGTHVDITEIRKSENFIKQTNQILEMIALGKPALEVYDAIALMYEKRHPGMRCSLLELEDGKLLHGGAPSMPKEYCDAVHGLEIGPNVGSCGTSTYSGKRVLVEDISIDEKWKNIKDIALPHGLRCCWSEPIIDSTGKVLGAFGMYYDFSCLPNKYESEDLLSASRLASIVMERDQSQKRTIRDQKIIFEQSKMAAMGEMLENIAHQWRQPLSVISTSATGLLLQQDMKLLNDNKIKETLTTINDFAQHLSQTIEDFRTFFDPKNTKTTEFNISNVVKTTLKLLESQLKDKDIEIIQSVEDYLLFL